MYYILYLHKNVPSVSAFTLLHARARNLSIVLFQKSQRISFVRSMDHQLEEVVLAVIVVIEAPNASNHEQVVNLWFA